ncbi:MAG: DNA gyrase/topoisomerase IV subunit B [Candidatus Micrarchaeales archaeon]
MDEEKNSASGNEQYDASKILVFAGIKGIRKRPAMYVGSTSSSGMHHLFQEVLDNAIDEFLAGYCKRIKVTLYEDNFIEIEDDGRGIPVDIMEKYQRPALEMIMLTPHTGAKFENKVYKVSGGLHGVGLSVVNALSEKVIVEVMRNGNVYHQEFGKGEKISELQIVGSSSSTGTRIKFKPDKEIFGDLKFDPELIKRTLKEQSFLNKGLRIIFKYNGKEEEYYHENGLVDFVKEVNKDKGFGPIIYFSKTIANVIVEFAMQYTNTFNENILSFANSIPTRDGGTHLLGLKTGLTKAFVNFSKKQNSKIKIEGEDCREGLTCIISVKLPNPEFEGQTKEKLGNDEVKGIVESVVSEGIERFLEEHPNEARLIFNKILLAAKAREEAKKAKELIRKKSIFEPLLPGKLSDCTESDPSKSELFIVEGESAGGSAKQARDRHFQAILPLKGKILNVEKTTLEKVLSSKEIKALIATLGTAIAEGFDINKIRYHKIIIVTDADVDGSHIRALLLTLFYRYFREVIQKGYLYIAQPPLYRIQYTKKVYYAYTDEQKEEVLKSLNENEKEKASVQRFKGLGEMNPEELWETTLNPEKRILKQITIEDAKASEELIKILMGMDAKMRRKFISQNTKDISLLDI